MLNCITQDINKYTTQFEGYTLGLGVLHTTKPSLFSLLSIMSPFFYQWEEGSPIPVHERAGGLEDNLHNLYVRSLSYDIGGMSLTGWLSLMETPTELYLNLVRFPLTSMPLLEFYNRDQISLIMRARCYTWLQHNKDKQLNNLFNIFTKEDENEVKANAYGKYYLPSIH